MDGETHVISGADYDGTSKTHEMATSYANLHANGGTVKFTALWDKDQVRYVLNHYKETLSGEYTILASGLDTT